MSCRPSFIFLLFLRLSGYLLLVSSPWTEGQNSSAVYVRWNYDDPDASLYREPKLRQCLSGGHIAQRNIHPTLVKIIDGKVENTGTLRRCMFSVLQYYLL